jgi:PAS domain S-box-containing protein
MAWVRIAYLGIPFIPAGIYHFTAAILRLGAASKRLVWFCWVTSLAFLVLIQSTDWLLTDLQRFPWGFYPRYGWLGLPYLVYFFTMAGLTILEYHRRFRGSQPDTIDRFRAKAFYVAFAVIFVGSVDYLPKLGIPVYPFGYAPVVLFLVLVSRAIWKYRLVNITPAFAAEQIIHTMSDALIVCDGNGVIRITNRSASTLLGYTPDELLGRPFVSLADPAGCRELWTAVRSWEFVDTEFTLLTRSRKPLSVSLSASILRNPHGTSIGTVVVARDIGERKRMERELYALNETLERRVKERTEELEAKIRELEWLNEVMMGREERIWELKEHLRGLDRFPRGVS